MAGVTRVACLFIILVGMEVRIASVGRSVLRVGISEVVDMRRLTTIVLLVWLIVLRGHAIAAESATATFKATAQCELFQSKQKRTNPGGLKTTVDATYSVVESLKADGRVTWLRVKTDDPHMPLRWVDAGCGTVDELPAGGSPAKHDNICRQRGQFDSYVLAVTWAPAFCERHRDRVECKQLPENDAANQSFSLHGLWPNRASCGIDYAYCGDVRTEANKFCNYPALPELSAPVQDRLAKAMPSARYGGCLDRHEWWKHGTCAFERADDYYATAVDLVEKLNQSTFVTAFIQPQVGKTVTRAAIFAAFDQAFGSGARRRVSLFCDREDQLTELRLSLPAKLDSSTPLQQLLERSSGPVNRGSCGERITLDSVAD